MIPRARHLVGAMLFAAAVTLGVVPVATAAAPTSVATTTTAAAPTSVATTTTLAAPTAVGYGAAPTIRATVRDAQSHAWGGHVVFSVDGTQFAVPAVDQFGHVSAALPATVGIGRHTLTVHYYPTAGIAAVASQARQAFDVTAAPSAITLSVGSPVLFGSTVPVSAHLTTTAPVAGAMLFLYNGTSLIDHQAVDARGNVVLSDRVLWRDRSVLRVLFKGSSTIQTSTRNVRLAINRAPSNVAMTVAAPVTAAGSSDGSLEVNVVATVTGAVAAPTGSALVIVDGVRGTPFTLTKGVGGISVTLAPGTHTLQVFYGGDFTHLPATSVARRQVVAAAAPTPTTGGCASTARVCIDLTHSLTWIQTNGKVSYGPVPITSGRPGYRTPAGTYHVYWKDIDHWSSTFNAPMPYSVFFNGGIAFHEGSLSVASHGCIHLSYASATTYFSTLQVGDTVDVFGYAPY